MSKGLQALVVFHCILAFPVAMFTYAASPFSPFQFPWYVRGSLYGLSVLLVWACGYATGYWGAELKKTKKPVSIKKSKEEQ